MTIIHPDLTMMTSNCGNPNRKQLDQDTSLLEKHKTVEDNICADESTKTCDIEKKADPKSIFELVRSKSSSKSVSWKEDADLAQVSYFEYDPTERVNVPRIKAMKKLRKIAAAQELKDSNEKESEIACRDSDGTLQLTGIPNGPGKMVVEPAAGSSGSENREQVLGEHPEVILPAACSNSSENTTKADSATVPDYCTLEQLKTLGDTAETCAFHGAKGDRCRNADVAPARSAMSAVPDRMVAAPDWCALYKSRSGHGTRKRAFARHCCNRTAPYTGHVQVPRLAPAVDSQARVASNAAAAPGPFARPYANGPPPLHVVGNRWHDYAARATRGGGPSKNKHWGQYEPVITSRPPALHVQSVVDGRHGELLNQTAREPDTYNGKIKNYNQRNRNWAYGPYSRTTVSYAQPCKYFTNLGYCKNPNCKFSH